MEGKLVLIIGPSGVGKSVILKRLRREHPELVFPRSATTRPRRQGEGDELYLFVKGDEFDELMRQHAFLEWATVHGGARYGTLLSEILPAVEAGKTVVREVDVQGFDSIRAHPLFSGTSAAYKLESIFILPENKEQLIARITKRSPMSGEELTHRLASMEKELTYAELCDVQILNKEGKIQETLQEVERCL